MTTDSSFANLKQKSMSSVISLNRESSNFTITAIEPSGFCGQVRQGMLFIPSKHKCAVCFRILMVLLKKSLSVFSKMLGTEAWINVGGPPYMSKYFLSRSMILGCLNVPLGSVMANQPSLQPGTSHLFDNEPRVKTGAIDPKVPIGKNGVLPKARCPYTSSAITKIPSFFAVSAICNKC
uniref:Uncharacterized protein n=1 Tax=Opuntia streptacantha TaxID=393608 RepID=A0A7C9DA70_OPUST